MASVGARLHQHIMIRGSEGLCPPEADDIFLFQRPILSKIITEIGKNKTKNFVS